MHVLSFSSCSAQQLLWKRLVLPEGRLKNPRSAWWMCFLNSNLSLPSSIKLPPLVAEPHFLIILHVVETGTRRPLGRHVWPWGFTLGYVFSVTFSHSSYFFTLLIQPERWHWKLSSLKHISSDRAAFSSQLSDWTSSVNAARFCVFWLEAAPLHHCHPALGLSAYFTTWPSEWLFLFLFGHYIFFCVWQNSSAKNAPVCTYTLTAWT